MRVEAQGLRARDYITRLGFAWLERFRVQYAKPEGPKIHWKACIQ
jgi:hypothetical protein